MSLISIVLPQNNNNFLETFEYFKSDNILKAPLKIPLPPPPPPANVLSRLPIISKMFPMVNSISVPSFMLLS